MSKLSEQQCSNLPAGTPALDEAQRGEYLNQLHGDWKVLEGKRLSRDFSFKDFVAALAFVNQVGDLAEADNHHPDITLSWGKAGVVIWTHTVGGLSVNDFILAAKIDLL